ncbi:hypothetical protein ACHWQZ_G007729 [Mnemiopsis leidyi]
MVRMILRVLIPLCVVNICFTHSLPKNCQELQFLCGGNEICIFENSFSTKSCGSPCPQGICLYRNEVEWFRRVRRSPNSQGNHPREIHKVEEEKVSDTYLHLHLNPEQTKLDEEQLQDLAKNITHFFKWKSNSIKDCQESLEHLTCAVVGLNPVLVSTNLALESNIDKITPIKVDSVGTSNKNASLLAAEDTATTVISQKMTISDVMIWVFGAILLLLLISLFLVYLVHKRQTGHSKLNNESEHGSSSELYYDYENLVRSRIQEQTRTHHRPPNLTHLPLQNLVRSRIQEQTSTHHRPPNLTQHQVASKQYSSDEKGSPEYIGQKMDIQSAHLALSYMEQYLSDMDKIGTEWERLCVYEAEVQLSDVGKRAENLAKNRFATVMPYDHNRVKLSNQHASDYINASFIYTESPKNPAYIASQGPLQNCSGDFWQMVWEQGVSEIIMLSLNDGIDCYQYWGTDGNGVYYHYQLHLVSEHANHPDYPDYIVRSFYLKNLQTYETRTVTQFHYVAWPMASSIPRSTQSILDFRRKVHKGYRGPSAPLLVHCNDGLGRTGTFILLDMTLNRICKGVKEIDMEGAVEHLRDQRAGMVVTKEQYAFALSAVVEEIHNILGELPSPKAGQFTPTMD